jgi:hypothetical protein
MGDEPKNPSENAGDQDADTQQEPNKNAGKKKAAPSYQDGYKQAQKDILLRFGVDSVDKLAATIRSQDQQDQKAEPKQDQQFDDAKAAENYKALSSKHRDLEKRMKEVAAAYEVAARQASSALADRVRAAAHKSGVADDLVEAFTQHVSSRVRWSQDGKTTEVVGQEGLPTGQSLDELIAEIMDAAPSWKRRTSGGVAGRVETVSPPVGHRGFSLSEALQRRYK